MNFGAKALAVAVGGLFVMGTMVATPAEAGGKKCKLEKEMTKLFSWKHDKRRKHSLFHWRKRKD